MRPLSSIFRLRLPVELRGWLAQQAMESHRSVTGEILARLEQTRKEDISRGRCGGEVQAVEAKPLEAKAATA
jgi:hypothetical protein